MERSEPLSVAVITLDEERNLERCLRSVAWADELVVVDAGSTDRTLEVAARHGAAIHRRSWDGYAAQKNFAIERTTHAWVLSLDADEWLTEAGAREVRRTLAAPRAQAYAFNRLTAFSGGFLRHTWTPDWQVRLFRKDRGRFAGGRVHESLRLEPGSRVERMRERLPHLAYRSIGEYVQRLDRYTGLAAASLHRPGRGVSMARLLFTPPLTFLKFYLLKRGFRDGVRGLLASAGSAFYVLVKYGKLWELERAPDPQLVRLAGSTAEDADPAELPRPALPPQ